MHAPLHRDPSRSYERRRPEQTVLYQVLAEHWPAFREQAQEAGGLPQFVEREVEAYLRCGLLEHGFVRVGAGKISARTLAANRGSRRVMHKCGLVFEREFTYPEDVIAGRSEQERAAVKYSITRPQWLAQRARGSARS